MRALHSAIEGAWKAARGPLSAVLGEERLGRLLDSLGLRAYKTKNFVLERAVRDGSSLLHRPHDQCIIDEVYEQGAYGPDEALREGQIVVDLGGHIGAFACLAARRVGPTGRVLACEPAPDTAALLRENLRRNGFTWATVIEAAVGEREGEARLFVPNKASDNPAANSLNTIEGRATHLVRLTTLDRLVAEQGLTRIDHLKIDIEGAELRALQGASRALDLTRRVLMEIHPCHVPPQAVLEMLVLRGFTPKVLSKKDDSWLVEAARA